VGASIILSMAGGLGLFLLGMNLMSDSIEKAAGAKLRSILEFFTTNRFTGILVGFLFTAIIQSSSACTVMVVSFVNSGLMNLYQAAGVIFGSNIGTTVTALLVSFKLERIAPVFLLTGVIIEMFGSKNQKLVKIADVIIGFGVLFMGLTSMSEAMSGMRDSQTVVNILSSLKSPAMAILVGTVLTMIVQSSSVTVSIMVLMANQGLIGLDMCFYLTLGCNIGSTSSALIASLSGKKDAKRAAMIHVLFNVIGTIIMYIALKFGMNWVLQTIRVIAGNDNGRIVAVAHLAFKVAEVIVLTPFITPIVKLAQWIVPGETQQVGYRDNFQLKYIGEHVVFNPATAVVDGINELERMASLASENLNRAMNALITLDEEDIAEVYEVEKNINFLNKSITDYLVKINLMTLPIEDSRTLGALFHVANDIERIGDHAENVADCAQRRIELGISFSKEAQREMGDMLNMVNTILLFAVEMFSKESEEHLHDIINLEDAIDEKERELQKRHVERLTKQECSPEAGMLFSDVISGLERVADHATNIAFSILNEEQPEDAAH
jgi:phosphate:Na+ symporter